MSLVKPILCLLAATVLVASLAAQAQTYQYDSAGRLAAANYPGGARITYAYDAAGNITRIQHAGATSGPLAPDGRIDTPDDDLTIETGDSVDFTGSGTDPDGATPLTYRWDFDGGAPESTDEDPGPTVFATAGSYTVEFFVTDATNLTDPTPDSIVVTVNDPTAPPPGGGGSGGGSNGDSSGGGGALLWMSLLLATVAAFRRRFALLAVALLVSGMATAQTSTWTQMASPASADLRDVWGPAADNVFAVGESGTIIHYDGSAWREYFEIDLPDAVNLNGIWGRSADDLYIVGEEGGAPAVLLHYDGNDWADVDLGPDVLALVGVWSGGPGEPLWVIGNGAWYLDSGLDPRDPGNWVRRSFNEGLSASFIPNARLTAIGGVADEVFVTGVSGAGADGGVYRNFRRFSSWRTNGVHAMSSTEMFIVGELSYRLDGDPATFGDWVQTPIMSAPLDVWGTSYEHAFAVGSNGNIGTLRRYLGPAQNLWETIISLPGLPLRAVHGFDETTAFAVGDAGNVFGYLPADPQATAANFPHAGRVNDHVNAFTGELVVEMTDLSLGQAFPVTFERYYASNLTGQRTVGGELGTNWTHNYEWRIDEGFGAAGDLVRIVDFRGREYVFGGGTGNWRLEELYSADVALTETSDYYLFADLVAERIMAFGKSPSRLEYIEDRNGNRHDLFYISGYLTSVADDFGNVLTLQHDPSQRLTSVAIPASGSSPAMALDFSYSNGVLSNVTERFGDETQVETLYIYDVASGVPGLLAWIDVGGAIDRSWFYDDQRRVQSTVFTGSGTFEYAWGADSLTVTMPGGVTRTLSHSADGELLAEQDGAGGTTQWSYDAFGRVSSVTDRAGRTTSWVYELESGLPNRITLPGDASVNLILEQGGSAAGVAFYDVVEVRYPDDSLEIYAVDVNGNTTNFRDRELNTWQYGYDVNGRIASVTTPTGGTTTYVRDPRGSIVGMTDPAGNTTNYAFDNYRRPVWIGFADGSTTELTWNGRRIAQIELASGEVRDYFFDPAGRLFEELHSDGTVIDYDYDDAGNLEIRTANDRPTTYVYDGFRRLSSVVSPVGDTRGFSYDVAGNLLEFSDGAGQGWSMEYRADGAMSRLVTPAGSVVDVDNTLHPRGLITSIAEGGEQVRFGYDDLGRIASVIDELERQTTIGRDANGRVTSVETAVADYAVTIARDALGRVAEVADAIGGTWGFARDEQGRVVTATDPLGQAASYGYDERNRVSSVTHADGVGGTIEYALNGIVSLVSLSDGTEIALDTSPEGRIMGGSNLALGWSTAGDLVDSNGIAMEYDGDGRIRTVTLAPGRVIEYGYDGNGEVTRVADWLGGETLIEPTDRGQPDLVTYPNGVQADYAYRANGRLTAIRYPTIGEVVLNVAANGQVSGVVRDLPGPGEIETLDLQYSFNVASEVERFAYDVRGNIAADDDRDYAFDAANRLRAYPVTGGTVELAWDALGNVVGSDAPGREREYVYNYALGRPQAMIERDGAGNDLWYYVFTAEGELLYRMSPDGARQVFHFDENGNTAFITDGSGAVIQTYFYSPLGTLLDESGSVDNDLRTGARNGARTLPEAEVASLGDKLWFLDSGQYLSRSGSRVAPEAIQALLDGLDTGHPFDPPANARFWGDSANTLARARRQPLDSAGAPDDDHEYFVRSFFKLFHDRIREKAARDPRAGMLGYEDSGSLPGEAAGSAFSRPADRQHLFTSPSPDPAGRFPSFDGLPDLPLPLKSGQGFLNEFPNIRIPAAPVEPHVDSILKDVRPKTIEL